jgi:hypothetical protein
MVGMAQGEEDGNPAEDDPHYPRTVSLVMFSVGAILLFAAPCLSLFSLIAVFLIGSSAGLVIGHRKSGCGGAVAYALAFGVGIIVALVIVIQIFGPRKPLDYVP